MTTLRRRIIRSPRWIVLTWRTKALRNGYDPAGEYLLWHHILWLLVLLAPGSSLNRPGHGQSSSVRVFVELGGDPVLAAVYTVLTVLTLVAVLRLSMSVRIVRTCLLGVLAISLGLAFIYVTGKPASLIAADAAIRALLAWRAYSSMDPD